MQDKKKLIVYVVATIVGSIGTYKLIGALRYGWHMLYYQGVSPYPTWSAYLFVGGLIMDLVLIFKVISAYGLFRLRPWARKLAIGVLTIDFLIVLFGAINHCRYAFSPPARPAWTQTTDVIVTKISLWPFYAIGILSIVFVFILTRKSVAEVFADNEINLHNKEIQPTCRERPPIG